MAGRCWSVFALGLAACSGGGGGGGTPAAAALHGVAATGAGIDGTVAVEDALGEERTGTATAGSFTVDVTGMQGPFLVRVTWTGGTLYSFASASGRVNITPLSHAIVLAAAGGASLDALYGAPGALAFANVAAALPGAKAALLDGLEQLLAAYGATGDPLTGAFAADHTGMDLLLDDVEFEFQNGVVEVTDRGSGEQLFCASAADLGSSMGSHGWTTNDGSAASDPAVAVDPSGHGLVVWAQSDTVNWHVESKWLGGGNAAARVSDGTGDAGFPRVAIDAAGSAVVVWARYAAGRNTIWANRFVAGTGWGTALQISANTTGDAYYPDVAVDAVGNAVATWYEATAAVNHFDVHTCRFGAGTAQWAAPQLLSNGTNSAYRSRVAADGDGDALVVFTQELHDGSISNDDKDVYVARAAANGAWSTPVLVNALAGAVQTVYGQPAVAIGADGAGMIAWVQHSTGSWFSIWAVACDATGAFGTAVEVPTGLQGDCYAPALASLGGGALMATWMQQENGTSFAAASRYAGGSGWDAPVTVSGGTGEVHDPQLTGDALGNASAVWYEIGANDVSVRSNRYVVGSGWSGAALVKVTPVDVNLAAGTPVVAAGANAAGRCMAVWGIDPP